MLPRARRDQLIVQEVAEETLVYDLEGHEAHCLNQTAALVWRYCDGKTTAAGIASLLCLQHGLPADENLVWQALRQLRRARLVQVDRLATERQPLARRPMSRRVALAMIAAPLVTTLAVPHAAMAASCGDLLASCGPLKPPCCSPLICLLGICTLPTPSRTGARRKTS
jgi:hypothetical protein